MRKILFSLVTLLGLFCGSVAANASCSGQCFWIGGTGTLNLTSDSAHWSLTTGGTTCTCEPATTDAIAFDSLSGGGTVTVNTGGTWTFANLTLSGFTGTLDFSANNNSVTTSGNVVDTSGANTLNMGNGTWTLSGVNSFFQVVSATTFNANSSTLAFTNTGGGSGSNKRLLGANKTFNIVTVAAASTGAFLINGGNITAFTVAAPNRIFVGGGTSTTITTFTSITATSGNEVLISTDSYAGGTATVSSANNFTCAWCAFMNMAFTGGGTFTASNSFDLGINSGITITAPSGGGGTCGRIIGG